MTTKISHSKKTKKTATKRNPADTTMRNIKALKGRISALEVRTSLMLYAITLRLDKLEYAKVDKIAGKK